MLTTALVPLDGSREAEQAVPYAQAILPDGGHLVLLQVALDGDLLLPELLGMLQTVPGELGEIDVARALLDQVKAGAGDGRLHWQTDVVRGEPAAEIVRAINRTETDVVVMTTHGRGALGRTVFGSVADRIARTAPVPVLLVRPQLEERRLRSAQVHRLVVPLDGSDLAAAALPVATELAQRLKTPVHLVRVINLAAMLAPMSQLGVPGMPPDIYDEVIVTARTEAEGYLAVVAERLTGAGVEATWAVLEGSAFVSIAEATGASDLVVMTSHGRGGALRWVLGSVAEKLVREAPCPVLLVPIPGRGTTRHARGGR